MTAERPRDYNQGVSSRLATSLAFAVAALTTTHAQLNVTAVRGEVVVLECVLTEGDAGRGEAHGAHAMARARDGAVMAVLTDDGPYVVVGDYIANGNAKILDFIAKRVEAKGAIADQDGRRTIRVSAMVVLKDARPGR